jgi:membrane protease YdiL (CAAX protease family)
LKIKRIIIFIETVGVISFLLIIYYAISFLLKIFKISKTGYLIINLFLAIMPIFICFLLVKKAYRKVNFTFFLKKLRFKRVTGKVILQAIGIVLIAGVLSGLIRLFLDEFEIPFNMKNRLDFVKNDKQNSNTFFIPITILMTVIISPLAEELLFRGYLLPKQEIALGKYAWILNGFAFTLAHLLVYDFASLLLISPISFLIAYKVQKHNDTSIGLLAHFFMNLGFIVRLLMV